MVAAAAAVNSHHDAMTRNKRHHVCMIKAMPLITYKLLKLSRATEY